ncbi:hypothetical protein BDV32DRAFT_6118 [Aspergillus pseudonomiae]|nr:hypothetical protein BDV32DRAFT_6118 [Aspergillus pseudonomiae]
MKTQSDAYTSDLRPAISARHPGNATESGPCLNQFHHGPRPAKSPSFHRHVIVTVLHLASREKTNLLSSSDWLRTLPFEQTGQDRQRETLMTSSYIYDHGDTNRDTGCMKECANSRSNKHLDCTGGGPSVDLRSHESWWVNPSTLEKAHQI